MNEIDVKDIASKLFKIASKPLSDSTIGEVLAEDGGRDTTVAAGTISAVFGATVRTGIHLLNSADDADADGIWGAKPGSNEHASETVDWRPQIQYQDGSAWLKYALSSDVTAKAGSEVGMAAGNFSGDRSLRLLSYRRHLRNGEIGSAVARDLAKMPSALSVSEVLRLDPGDGVALKVRGRLTGTLVLTWSDLFSTSLAGLSSIAGVRGPEIFAIKLPAEASVTFSLAIEDDLALSFVRLDGSPAPLFRVAVRKSSIHDRRFKAQAGISAGFANPDASRQVVMTVLSGLLEVPADAVTAIRSATSLEMVPEQYRGHAVTLMDRLNIEAVDDLRALADRIDQLQTDITARIDELVTAKVTLGLQYEYLRISTDASIFEANLTATALRRLHSSFLSFDLARVLDDTGQGLTLRFFLHEATIKRVRAWGFSLGATKWLNLKSTQKREGRFVERRYITPAGEARTHAYAGSTRYVTNVNGWSAEYGATLKADVADARPLGSGLPQSVKSGLHLWWEENSIKPSTELGRLVDDAVLWGVVDESETDALAGRLREALRNIPKCKPRMSLLLGEQGMHLMLAAVAGSSDAQWCRHAARALPWYSKEPFRATCAVREATYTPFFRAFQSAGGRSLSGIKRLIADSLRPFGSSLYGPEGAGNTPWTVFRVLYTAGLIERGFAKPLPGLRVGAARMARTLQAGTRLGDIDDDFRMMSGTFEQTYLLRIVASFLSDVMSHAVWDEKTWQPTMTIEYSDGGEARSLVVGRVPS